MIAVGRRQCAKCIQTDTNGSGEEEEKAFSLKASSKGFPRETAKERRCKKAAPRGIQSGVSAGAPTIA